MDKQIQFKLMTRNLSLIRKASKELGLSVSSFCRMSCLEKCKNMGVLDERDF